MEVTCALSCALGSVNHQPTLNIEEEEKLFSRSNAKSPIQKNKEKVVNMC